MGQVKADLQARLQAKTVSRMLTQTVEIWRIDVSQDNSGYAISALKKFATLPGRVQQLGEAKEEVIGERVQSVSSNAILLPAGTVIEATDVLIVGANKYQVQGTDSGRADPLYLRVFVVQSQ